MNFNPSYYNDFTDSIQPANRLINVIDDYRENNNDLGIVLDIGCGTGSTTRLLNDLKCERIIGCDIDHKMIGFAQKFNKTPTIEYIVQDFGVDWNQLDERVRRLAGKVSVIFTNYAMAWIFDNRHNAANNIGRLLRPDGLFVGNILYDGDIFQHLPPVERQKAFQLMPYPTEQEFVGGWVSALRSGGLSRIELDYWEPKIVMSEQLYVNEYINIPMNWYKSYYHNNNNNGHNDHDIDKVLKKLIFEERCRRLEQTSDQIEIVNRLWQFVARRSH